MRCSRCTVCVACECKKSNEICEVTCGCDEFICENRKFEGNFIILKSFHQTIGRFHQFNTVWIDQEEWSVKKDIEDSSQFDAFFLYWNNEILNHIEDSQTSRWQLTGCYFHWKNKSDTYHSVFQIDTEKLLRYYNILLAQAMIEMPIITNYWENDDGAIYRN